MIEDSGDKSTFESLYRRYRGLMFYVARQILSSDQDAEDAVHNAFVSIAENIKKFSHLDAHKTKACVVIIVERKAIDLYRSQRRHKTVPLDEAAAGFLPSPGENASAQAMARLPGKYRELLYLKHFCGFKSKEIAEMMHMSDEMVRRTLSDARSALRKELEREGIEA